MVDINQETRAETDSRLRRVIRDAKLVLYEDLYGFVEFAARDFTLSVRPNALALIRDGDRWSQFVPSHQGMAETFGVWSFHFPSARDNSGFVGWLGSRLKDLFGTGVIVICGYNAAEGGVFDYWGCPATIREAVFKEVAALCTAKNIAFA